MLEFFSLEMSYGTGTVRYFTLEKSNKNSFEPLICVTNQPSHFLASFDRMQVPPNKCTNSSNSIHYLRRYTSMNGSSYCEHKNTK